MIGSAITIYFCVIKPASNSEAFSSSNTSSYKQVGELDSIITSCFDYTVTNPYQDDGFEDYNTSGGCYAWEVTSDGNIKSTNEGIGNSYSGFKLSVNVTETAVFAITFYVPGAEGSNYLYVYNLGTYEDYAFTFADEERFYFVTVKYLLYEGTSDFGFYYMKYEDYGPRGGDCAYISSIEIMAAAELMTITLDNQGATTAGTTSVSVAEGVVLPEITLPTKTGYGFLGYYTATNGSGTKIYDGGGWGEISASPFTTDTTLYAYWEQKRTITLDNQGATTSGTTSVSVAKGERPPKITPPTKTGYGFLGYYTATNGSGTKIYDGDGWGEISASPFTTDTTLYAYWGQKRTITLDNQGATTAGTTSVSVAKGEELLDITPPTKTGYAFGGYYTATNGDGTMIYDEHGWGEISASPFTTDTTLYAYWKAFAGVAFDNQSATSTGTTRDIAIYGEALYSITPPTRTGYTFGGYYTAANGGGTKIYNADGTPAISASIFTTDTTLYAYWTAGTYTVTLNNQSATTAGTASVKATYKSSMPSITTPTKIGYAFGGYYTAANGGGTKIYNADGTPAISASIFTIDTTLYAYWTDWYKVTMTGSTTAYETYYSNDEEFKFISLTITPAAGHIISQFSFDNTNWYDVVYSSSNISDTLIAIGVMYFANTNYNALALEFKGLMTSNLINIYTKTTAGSYSGLKIAGGGNVDGVAVQSTYGGVAMVVGANFAEMTDDDYIICSTMAIDNYEFMYWMDSAGNKLSFDESVKFKKKDVYGSIITAVFAPVGTDPNTYVVVDNSE